MEYLNAKGKRLLTFLTQHQILVHVYNYYGYYAGTYYPRTTLNSGLILLKQAEHYLDTSLRMALARAFVRGAIRNMLYVLRRYQSQGIDLSAHIDTLSAPLEAIAHAETPAQLMEYAALQNMPFRNLPHTSRSAYRIPSRNQPALLYS